MSKTVLIIVGALSVLAGLYALFNPLPATLAATVLAGWSFLILGILQIVAVFKATTWGGRIWALLLGVVTALVGIQILANPLGGALTLTFVVAILFLASGVVKVFAGLTIRGIEYRGVILLSGIVSVVLGVMILTNFPYSAAAVLGILLGVELLSNGITALAMALSGEVRDEAAA